MVEKILKLYFKNLFRHKYAVVCFQAFDFTKKVGMLLISIAAQLQLLKSLLQ